jgi:hypothetical protein
VTRSDAVGMTRGRVGFGGYTHPTPAQPRGHECPMFKLSQILLSRPKRSVAEGPAVSFRHASLKSAQVGFVSSIRHIFFCRRVRSQPKKYRRSLPSGRDDKGTVAFPFCDCDTVRRGWDDKGEGGFRRLHTSDPGPTSGA